MSAARKELAKLFAQQARINQKIADLLMEGVEVDAPVKKKVPQETQWAESPFDPAWRKYCVETRPDLVPEDTYRDFQEDYLSTNRRWKNWKLVWQRWVRNQRAATPTSGGSSGIPMGGQALIDYARSHGAPAPRAGESERNYRDRVLAFVRS